MGTTGIVLTLAGLLLAGAWVLRDLVRLATRRREYDRKRPR